MPRLHLSSQGENFKLSWLPYLVLTKELYQSLVVGDRIKGLAPDMLRASIGSSRKDCLLTQVEKPMTKCGCLFKLCSRLMQNKRFESNTAGLNPEQQVGIQKSRFQSKTAGVNPGFATPPARQEHGVPM